MFFIFEKSNISTNIPIKILLIGLKIDIPCTIVLIGNNNIVFNINVSISSFFIATNKLLPIPEYRCCILFVLIIFYSPWFCKNLFTI